MSNPTRIALATAVAAAFAGTAFAAPDWTKAPKKNISVFYPGVSSIEWTFIGTEHGGARAMRKGETCASCHSDEAADMGKKMVTGQKVEPDAASVKGKAPAIPVTVQAAYDATNFYMRFTWKQPPAGQGKKMVSGQKIEPDAASVKGKSPGFPVTVQAAYDATNFYMRFSWKQPPAGQGKKMDEKSSPKVAVMLQEDGKVEYGALGGCWASCHHDLRTMPDVNANAAKIRAPRSSTSAPTAPPSTRRS